MAMNFQIEKISCLNQRNISKAVTKQHFWECTYLKSFRGTLRPRRSRIGASQKGTIAIVIAHEQVTQERLTSDVKVNCMF